MTKDQLKTYISRVKELEISCYQQQLFRNHLKGTLVNLDKSKQSIALKQENITPDTIGSKIFQLLACAFMLALYGALIGAMIGLGIALIYAFVHFIGSVTSDNIVYSLFLTVKNLFFLDLIHFGKTLGSGIVIGLCVCGVGGFIVGAIIGIASWNTKKRIKILNNKIAVKNSKIDEQTTKLQSQMALVKKDLEVAESSLSNTKDLLRTYYATEIIYPKYRNLVAVSMFDEYLQSGRCFTLEGHEGAYNIYENEIRMNLILTKLDDIIDRLDQIAENQYMLAEALKQSQREIIGVAESMNRSLQNIENSSVVSAYYNEITSRNTSFLAWITYFKN